MDAINLLLEQLTLGNLFINLVWTIIMAGLVRLGMTFYGYIPSKERAYWFGVVPVMFGVIAFLTMLVHPLEKPKFTLTIKSIRALEDESMLLSLRMRNVGAPSAVEDWWVSAKVLNDSGVEQIVKFTNQFIPAELIIESVPYSGKDAMYNKTGNSPIGKGQFVTGLLWVKPKDVPFKLVNKPTTILEVHYRDVFGGEGSASLPFLYPKDKLGYLPGLESPK